MVGNVRSELVSLCLVKHLVVECSDLLEIIVGVGILESSPMLSYLDLRLGVLGIGSRTSSGVGLVVHSGTAVSIHSALAVSLVVVDLRSIGVVDWHLVVVSTESMSMGVGIGEQSSLEHLIV